MTQPKKKPKFEQVLSLVEQLAPDEQIKLWRKLDGKAWIREWEKLADDIEKRRQVKGLPPITDEDISAEFKAYRSEERRAQGSC